MSERRFNRHSLALLAYLGAILVVSALTDVRHLAVVALAVVAVFRGHAARALRKSLLLAGPYVVAAVAAVLVRERTVGGHWGGGEVALSLALRCLLLAVLAVLMQRVNLVEALAPSWTLSTLLTVTLSQIHLFRRLVRDFRQAFKSRSAVKPTAVSTLRAAATLSGSCLQLSVQHARDVADALRARGV